MSQPGGWQRDRDSRSAAGPRRRPRALPDPHEVLLVEREEEVRSLEEALRAAALEGRGSTLYLEGPAGIGKTSLLACAAHRAHERDFGVLSARASTLGADAVFGLAGELLEPLLSDGIAVPDHLRSALPPSVPETLAGNWDAGGSQMAQAMASAIAHLYDLLAGACTTRPTAVIVDDLHWADRSSLRFLGHLARRSAGLPVVVVLAARPNGEWANPSLRTMLLRDAHVRPMRPRLLSRSGVAELVCTMTSTASDAAFTTACHRMTGGNPFYLAELLRTCSERSLLPLSTNVTEITRLGAEGVALSVDERLDRLPREARSVAEALAITGDGCPPAWIAELSGLEFGQVLALTDELAAVAILTATPELRFAHPILEVAVYESMPAGRRAELHRTCATLAHTSHRSPLPHLLRAPAPVGAWAVEALREAASEAIRAGAPDAAVGFLRRALEEELNGSERCRMLLELGTAEALARDSAAHAHLQRVLVESQSPDDRVVAAMTLWTMQSFDGRGAEGLAMLRSTISEAPGARADLRLRLELELARATRSLRSTASEGRERILKLRERLDHGTDPLARVGLGLVAYDLMLANRPAEEVLNLLHRALPLDDGVLARGESQLLHLPFYTLIYCEAFTWLAEVIAQFERATARRGAAIGTVIADLWSALAAFRCGQMIEAEARASRALAGGIERSWRFGQAASQLFLAEIAIERDDLRAAEALSRSAWRAVTDGPDLDEKGWADHVLHARSLWQLATGDAEGALRLLEDVGHRHDEWLATCPSELAWRSNAALSAHQLGDDSAAATYAIAEVELAGAFGARRALGVALRVHGVVTGSEASLREAVNVLRDSPALLEHARALYELGRCQLHLGRSDEARGCLRQAIASADELGGLALARRARVQLRAAGGRPRRPSPESPRLSSAEAKAAHLAASGISNPEVAEALGLSRRTVESHLYSAFKKLGIRSRTELASALASSGGPAPDQRR
ncbi:MAG: AAA family ATPase [Actinomycetota bacterium]|nr:AAA family ATPase [Actinomycetota bacterium]